MIELKKLKIGYKTGKKKLELLQDINAFIRKGELLAVIGKNGSGKSTLLRTLAGLHKPLSGTVYLNGDILSRMKTSRLAREVSFVSTEVVKPVHMRVEDLVSLGRAPYTGWFGSLHKTDRDMVEQAIRLTGLESMRHESVLEISDGQRQRAMIARTLAQDTGVIILDEPTAFLDLPGRYEIVRLLNDLACRQSKTIIFSTHDLQISLQEADRLWLIRQKEIVDGAPEDLAIGKKLAALFSGSAMDFDPATGHIQYARRINCSISLRGKGDAVEVWTKKSLQRLGLEVVERGGDMSVRIAGKGKRIKWILSEKSHRLSCDSIYALTLQIRKRL